ncbi:MAG TPA: dipeptidase [Anaerolineae bacterium]|nr:dipeptidase [Anaerolineae bacterium]HID85177.1 dipeptidase [Anaerolineales bacterium]HIQ09219.1 dipeptidase [Anaerolineaceae bacterium]
MSREQALAYLEQHAERFLAELESFLRIPSISTLPEHKADMERTANWVAENLRAIGAENVQVFPTAGHPVVYGELRAVQPNAPTVLVYGHYDVQPAEPLEAWHSPPFEPTVRGERLYARGATDMKGQVIASLKAAEAAMHGGLPINLKFLIEGEEEVGSPNLAPFIAGHKDLLACDFCLNPDAGMIAPDLPTITYALRGLAYFELRVYGPKQDLHSGIYGGVVHNPAQALAELIAGMHDEQGRVTLPGFYDKVRPLDDEERAELARLPMDEAFYLAQTGAPALWGEAGYTPVERVGARPTLEVNGLYSGFIGEGAKTVLPAYAMAKISCRLVPDQDPDEVAAQMRAYLEQHAPPTIRWELEVMHGGPASITDRKSPWVQALAQAMEQVWGVRPAYKREGGSIPVVAQIQEILGKDSVLTGFGLPDGNLHAPNENLHLPTWRKGIMALVHFFYNLAD